MAKYKIQIKELLTKVVEVEADNRREALVKAKTAYANEEITMPENLKEVVFGIIE